MNSVQGQALIASPYLTDPNFMRSVVYIIRHDADGALGLILNRPMQTRIGQLLEQLCEQEIENELPVYCGGPVDGPLVLLEAIWDGDTAAVCVASEQQRILDVCRQNGQPPQPTEHYRLFDGYAGWSPGQLDSELQSGGWMVWDIQPHQVFSDPDALWELAKREIGREILAGGIDPARIPEDPACN